MNKFREKSKAQKRERENNLKRFLKCGKTEKEIVSFKIEKEI